MIERFCIGLGDVEDGREPKLGHILLPCQIRSNIAVVSYRIQMYIMKQYCYFLLHEEKKCVSLSVEGIE